MVLLGDAAVGKTTLLKQYITGQAPKSHIPTIGVELSTRTVAMDDGVKLKAQIWDTAGEEKYRAMTAA